jgi:hypothetical protein
MRWQLVLNLEGFIMFLGWQGIYTFVGVVVAIVVILAFFAKIAEK